MNRQTTSPKLQRTSERVNFLISALLVLFGGVIGSLARALAQSAVPDWGWLPLSTFLINLTGAFLLGFLAVLVQSWVRSALRADRILQFFGVGILGGFTTFSAVALDSFVLLDEGMILPAGIYLLATILLGTLMGMFGMLVARSLPLIKAWSAKP